MTDKHDSSVTYLTTPIAEVRNDPPPRGSGLTREGYTKRSGAPTARMIRLQGEKRWRRLMVWQFSNLGTMFVNIGGKPHVVREEDIPRMSSSSAVSHARKKSPPQLQREIDAALAKSSSVWLVQLKNRPYYWTRDGRWHKDINEAKRFRSEHEASALSNQLHGAIAIPAAGRV